MLKKIMPITVIAVLVILGVFSGCYRKHGCVSPEKKANFIVKRLSKELDLTDEQKTKLNQIKDEILVKVKDLKEKHVDMQKEVISLIKSDKIDRNSINNIINMREAKFKELKPFIADKIIEFHSMLTPEQKNKLAEKIEKHHKGCK